MEQYNIKIGYVSVIAADRWISDNFRFLANRNSVALKCAYILYERSVEQCIDIDDNDKLVYLVKNMYESLYTQIISVDRSIVDLDAASCRESDWMVMLIGYVRFVQDVIRSKSVA